jgi:hypothetical protein
MGRETRLPVARWSLALGFVLLLVACGNQAADGPVIGARPNPDVGTGAVSFDPSPLAAEFEAQLAAINSVQSIGETALAAGELPIDSVLTAKQSLRLGQLQVIGNALIAERLNAVAGVRGQVAADGLMSSGQKSAVMGLLDASSTGLTQLRLTIAREQLVDGARSDLVKIGHLRVYGLVLPQARMLIVAYQLASLAAMYSAQRASLQQQIYTAEAYGKDGAPAQALVNDLSIRIATVSRSSSGALAQLQGLSPSGYPANRASLISARGSLVVGKVASDQAASDVKRARAAIP